MGNGFYNQMFPAVGSCCCISPIKGIKMSQGPLFSVNWVCDQAELLLSNLSFLFSILPLLVLDDITRYTEHKWEKDDGDWWGPTYTHSVNHFQWQGMPSWSCFLPSHPPANCIQYIAGLKRAVFTSAEKRLLQWQLPGNASSTVWLWEPLGKCEFIVFSHRVWLLLLFL